MRFSTIVASALLGTFATAAETVHVKKLSIRDNNGIKATSFRIQPAGVSCASTKANALADNKVVSCGKSKYRFAIVGSNGDYTLTLYKATGVAVGITGKTHVSANCRAAGNGVDDDVCSQVGPITVTLS